MRHYVGLDMSIETTNVCVVDNNGIVTAQAVVPTNPTAIADYLLSVRRTYARVGFESMALATWIYEGLARRGLPAICVESRHASGFLNTRLNKTDRNDAHGLADMMRASLYRTVHIKTKEAQQLRALLTTRKLLQTKMLDIESGIRGILCSFGLKVRRVKSDAYQAYIEQLAMASPMLEEAVGALLAVRSILRSRYQELDKRVIQLAHADPVCTRLMTAPGVGPIVAMTYRTVIDVPARFQRSRTVGAHIGLTYRAKRSGKSDPNGPISRWGDKGLRSALYTAGQVILMPGTGPSDLRDWGLAIAARRGRRRANIAVARRLAVILHTMWVDGTDFKATMAIG